jgi:hypothetical protein
MNAHFFDLNSLITMNSKVWIVNTRTPNKPLIRISKSEFNLLRKGVYKKDNINFNIDGQTYWLSEELFNKIKIKSKNNNVNISELSFSMQEFMNKDIIESGDFTIHLENIRHLKNSQDDIYVICSKNSKRSYESLIEKLEEKLLEFGLKIKNFYFVSETFYNRDRDDIVHKKVRLALQHIIGLKTADTKFTEEEITKYDQVSLYDDDINTIKLAKGINDVLQFLVKNSDDEVKEKVKEVLKMEECELIINQVTFNKVNPFITTKVELNLNKIVKTFENFIYKKD